MDDDERQRRIQHYEEMERTVSYGPDKAEFRRRADELRVRAATTPAARPEPVARRRWL